MVLTREFEALGDKVYREKFLDRWIIMGEILNITDWGIRSTGRKNYIVMVVDGWIIMEQFLNGAD